MTITAAADGSALGNPGPAGWAWYVDDANWAAGGWKHATNNQGELMAVLDLFEATAHLDDDLHILCDSQYVINCITKWMPGWKKKGWRKGDGKPVMNVDLLKRIDEAIVGRRYRFEWVKGHVGHVLNEAADVRARAVAEAFQRGKPIPEGPGLTTAGTGSASASAAPRRSVRMEDADSASTPDVRTAEAAGVSEAAPSLFSFDDPIEDDAAWSRRDVVVTLDGEEYERLVERARRAGRTPAEFLRGLV